MKKLKDDFQTIIEVIIFGLLYLSLSTANNPILSYLSLGLCMIFWTWNIYSKIKYRKGKCKYLLIPTLNDEYSKMTSITIGLIIIVLVIILRLWKPEIFHFDITMLIVGTLLLINGILDLPKGKIEFSDKFLLITGLKNKIETKSLKSLQITSNEIILVDNTEKVIRLNNFNIDINSAAKIEDYLATNSGNEGFLIKNNVC